MQRMERAAAGARLRLCAAPLTSSNGMSAEASAGLPRLAAERGPVRALPEEWVSAFTQTGRVLNGVLCLAHADFAEILVPLSQSTEVSVGQKKQMIGKFLEVSRSMGLRVEERVLTARWERRLFPYTFTRRRRTRSALASSARRSRCSRARSRAP